MRIFSPTLVVFGAVLLVWAEPSAATYTWPQEYHVRPEWQLPNNLTGYLTWNDGKGGISWNPQAATEDHTADVAGCQQLAFNIVQTCTEGTLEFLSEPLPRTLFLNVSNDIAIDFLVTNFMDGRMELNAGQSWLGGAHRGYVDCNSDKDPCPYWGYPTGPSGYFALPCRISPELAILPAGVQLRLTIHFTAFQPSHGGMKGDHRSIIKIPFLTDDEAFFQYPEETGQATSGAASISSQSMGTGSSSLFVALAGFGVGPRTRRERHLALTLLLTASAFAGCIQPGGGVGDAAGPGESGGDSDVRFVPQGEGDYRGLAGTGSLEGSVRDEVGQPVAAAQVILRESLNVTITSAYGRFTFLNLPAGGFTLVVQKQGYKTYTTPVLVVASNRTLINVLLVRVQADASLPHAHDYWGTSSSLLMFDDSVPNTCRGGVFVNKLTLLQYRNDALTPYGKVCEPGKWLPVPLKRPKTSVPNLIVPGTGDVEVTLTWADPKAPRQFGLVVWANDAFDYHWGVYSVYRLFFPRASGEPFHVRVNREMTDPGHALFTTWQFGIFVWDDAYLAAPSTSHVGEDWTVHVKMELHRSGVLAIEAAHRDFWGSNQTLEILNAKGVTATSAVQGFGAANLTPPGTTWLEATETWDNPPTPSDVHWNHLYYRSADYPSTCHPPGTWSTPPDCVQEAPPPNDAAAQTLVWRIPVKEAQTDPYYARAPNWNFFIGNDDAHKSAANDQYNIWSCNQIAWRQGSAPPEVCHPMHLSLRIVAHRDAMPTS